MLKIRPVTLADAPELVKIYAPYESGTEIGNSLEFNFVVQLRTVE